MNIYAIRRACVTSLVAVGLFGASIIPATAAAPEIVSDEQFVPAGSLCSFPVLLTVEGKQKIIGPEKGTHKVTSPNFKVTTVVADNEGNPVGKSRTYTATGTVFFTLATDEEGNQYFEVKATGNNLLFVPNDKGSANLVYVTGNVNYAVKLDKATEVRRFSGAARQVDICQALT